MRKKCVKNVNQIKKIKPKKKKIFMQILYLERELLSVK